MAETIESEYYSFREFDEANARKALSYYVPFFDGSGAVRKASGTVLELASGPGVFLDLLSEAGVECEGVDTDHGMVTESRERGHTVTLGDAFNHLRALPADSLGGLFAAHFLEHLPAERAAGVYQEAARVLRPGALFVAAVPNAACRSIMGYDFWRDPTHVRFYDPVALAFFAEQAGLQAIDSGGNPNNHPGPPPNLPHDADIAPSDLGEIVGPTIREAGEAIKEATRSRFLPNTSGEVIADALGRIGHLVWVLNQQVTALQAANARLLAELYQPNEVYVAVRKAEAGEDGK